MNSIKLSVMLLFALLHSIQGKAQLQGRIMVGNIYLDFITNPPSSLVGATFNIGICDINGNFLFGSDGLYALDKFGNFMPNSSLNTQNSINSFICPYPNNANKYFIFSNTEPGGLSGNGGSSLAFGGGPTVWKYGIVDMSLNSGLGDLVSASNVLLDSSTTKLAGIGICNGAEYWVVALNWATDTISAYKITSTGISATPVKSKAGSINGIYNDQSFDIGMGQMRFAANGNWLVNTRSGPNGTVEVFTFNKLTGQINFAFSDTLALAKGCSFSPDCSKLYATGAAGLIQYDMNAGAYANIVNSRTLIQPNITLPPNNTIIPFGYLINVINGQMYVKRSLTLTNELSTIEQPNNLGLACSYNPICPVYQYGSGYTYALPNMLENYTLLTKDTAYLYYTNCKGLDSIPFKSSLIEATANFQWNFGDPASGASNASSLQSPLHNFSDTGSYSVQLIVSSLCGADTLTKTIIVDSIPKTKISPNVIYNCIPAANHTINVSGASKYKWIPNTFLSCDSCASIIVNPNTTTNYTVTGSSPNGCITKDTIQLNIIPLIANVINTDSICQTTMYTATSLSSGAGISWQWLLGDGTIKNNGNPISHNYAPGNYVLQLILTDTLGCADTLTKNVFVDAQNMANFNLSDSILCVGESISIADTLPNNTNIVYDFGDGINVDFKNPLHSYETAGLFNISLTVDNVKCANTFNVKSVTINAYPIVNIGADTSYCPGYTAPITLSASGSNILWSTGSKANTIIISEPNTYYVNVTNVDCASADTIKVLRDCYLNVPNSFTPDGDGLNDYFMPMDLATYNMQSFSMKIFNRWGEQIFNTQNVSGRGWDGKFGNKPQPMGTYIYQINATFKNGNAEVFSGNVILLR
jgi:gliding motility-associated-like protein